jgi:plasmid maintenance system antidote protein VapI
MKNYILYKLEEFPMPHIGELLKQYFLNNRTRKSSLARILGVSPPVITKYKKRDSLQCGILWRLSYALNHNFFADLAKQLPAEFTSNVPIDTSNEEEIELLNEEVKLLKAKLEALEKVLGIKQK